MKSPAQHSRLWFDRPPHPRSPAAKLFDWSSVSVGHPDAPAARYIDWTSQLRSHPESPAARFFLGVSEAWSAAADEQRTVARDSVEKSLEELAGGLRGILPEIGLQVAWDRQMGFFKEAHDFSRSFAVTEPAQVLQHVQRHIGWVDCHLRGTLTRTYELAVRPTLEQIDSLRTQSIAGDQEELYRGLQVLAERFYEAATESVQEHLAEAQKAGKQQEFIVRWRARMLACGAQASGGAVEAPPEPPPARRPPKKSESGEEAVKTWIAIQLVDEDGNPVPGVAYQVTLPDGLVMSGSLDDQGMARFDEIDPGQCKVTFPEIHAKEWKPL